MNCKNANKKISMLIDGLLDNENKRLLMEHINVCDDCKKLYDDMIGLKSKLSELPEVLLPEGIENKIHFALEREAIKPKKKTWVKYTVVAMPVAVTAVAVVLGISYIFSGGLDGNFSKNMAEMKISGDHDNVITQKAESAPRILESVMSEESFESDAMDAADEEGRMITETTEEILEGAAMEMPDAQGFSVFIEYAGESQEDIEIFAEKALDLVEGNGEKELIFDDESQTIKIYLPIAFYEELLILVLEDERAFLLEDTFNQDEIYDENLLFEVDFLFQK